MTAYENLTRAANGNMADRQDGDQRHHIRATVANAQATLAAAEQQRIANLLTLATVCDDLDSERHYIGMARSALLGDAAWSVPTNADDLLKVAPSADADEDAASSVPDARRIEIDHLPVGVQCSLGGAELAYRRIYLQSVLGDRLEDTRLKTLARRELESYDEGAGS